jgi:hypothetical protein
MRPSDLANINLNGLADFHRLVLNRLLAPTRAVAAATPASRSRLNSARGSFVA